MSPDAELAVHGAKLSEIERWKERHEREDDERHVKLGTDVSKLITGFATLNTTLEPIVKAYWGEDSSKVTHLRESRDSSKPPKHSKMSPEVRQGGIIAGLVTVVLALAEVIKAIVHPAPPPPPSTAEIAAQIAKALAAPHQEKP